jgi:hypothetical protein
MPYSKTLTKAKPLSTRHLKKCVSTSVLLLSILTQTAAWARPWPKVPSIVLVAPENDARLQAAHEAIDFWNRTFAEIGTPFRLGPVVHTTVDVPADALQGLSAQVLSRPRPLEFPDSLQRLPGDVTVVLSDGDFISFTAYSSAGSKVLVGIRSDRLLPLTLPNVARNLIAHELGHAIGLGHNDDPTMLMCGRPAPCRPSAFQSQEAKFFPLTENEKSQLLKMYPSNWTSHE